MAFGWFKGGEEDVDVASLILKKSYARAAKALRARLEAEPANLQALQQLADCLVGDGKTDEAVPYLERLADLFAKGGFVAKAIAVLKKIQRLDPARTSIDQKLARLFKERESEMDLQTTHRRVQRELTVRERPAAPEPAPERAAPPPREEPAPAPMVIERGGAADTYEIQVDEMSWSDDEITPVVAPSDDRPIRTPLFSDLTSDELVAVMNGMTLRTFDPGDVVLTEGEPGDSLFVLTTGRVKAFVKDATGKSRPVRTMEEGAFFGEISILEGKPRSATVTAATTCELLELDRGKLDVLAYRHPHILDVMRRFCEERLGRRVERPDATG